MSTLPVDGYIFTPVDEPYPKKPKWSTLLKWKPPELNSIDFAMKKGRIGGTWDLYVGREEGLLVPFSPFPTVQIDEKVLENASGMSLQDVKIGETIGIIEICVGL